MSASILTLVPAAGVDQGIVDLDLAPTATFLVDALAVYQRATTDGIGGDGRLAFERRQQSDQA